MMNKNVKDINSYIIDFPKEVQYMLKDIRETIAKAAPKAVETISYGIPTFKQNKNLVHFAGYKNHIGFYPGAGAIEGFAKELAAYKLSKGTVQFPLDKKLPLALITKIVKFRVKQDEEKAKLKSKVKVGK
ncbi:MAG: DUF1801 domain-containing protein [Ferruginibacter sp.]